MHTSSSAPLLLPPLCAGGQLSTTGPYHYLHTSDKPDDFARWRPSLYASAELERAARRMAEAGSPLGLSIAVEHEGPDPTPEPSPTLSVPNDV